MHENEDVVIGEFCALHFASLSFKMSSLSLKNRLLICSLWHALAVYFLGLVALDHLTPELRSRDLT